MELSVKDEQRLRLEDELVEAACKRALDDVIELRRGWGLSRHRGDIAQHVASAW
jgi:hypothetical protein